jgi:hypothetical protein
MKSLAPVVKTAKSKMQSRRRPGVAGGSSFRGEVAERACGREREPTA